MEESDKQGAESLFSETEREVIGYLIEHPEMSYSDIADERGVSRGAVNNAVARVRDKTRVSFATLIDNPHTREVAEELSEEDLEALISLLNGIADEQ